MDPYVLDLLDPDPYFIFVDPGQATDLDLSINKHKNEGKNLISTSL